MKEKDKEINRLKSTVYDLTNKLEETRKRGKHKNKDSSSPKVHNLNKMIKSLQYTVSPHFLVYCSTLNIMNLQSHAIMKNDDLKVFDWKTVLAALFAA